MVYTKASGLKAVMHAQAVLTSSTWGRILRALALPNPTEPIQPSSSA